MKNINISIYCDNSSCHSFQEINIMRTIFLTFVLIFFSIPLFAHSGGTDSRGGHHDRKNGGYHYHHGRGPHQHENGNCPYNNNSASSSKWYIVGIGVLGFIGYYTYKNR